MQRDDVAANDRRRQPARHDGLVGAHEPAAQGADSERGPFGGLPRDPEPGHLLIAADAVFNRLADPVVDSTDAHARREAIAERRTALPAFRAAPIEQQAGEALKLARRVGAVVAAAEADREAGAEVELRVDDAVPAGMQIVQRRVQQRPLHVEGVRPEQQLRGRLVAGLESRRDQRHLVGRALGSREDVVVEDRADRRRRHQRDLGLRTEACRQQHESGRDEQCGDVACHWILRCGFTSAAWRLPSVQRTRNPLRPPRSSAAG